MINFVVIQGLAETGSEESDNQWMIAGKSSTHSEVVFILFKCFITASVIRPCLCRLNFQAAICPISFL